MGRQIDKAAKKIGDLKFWLHFITWGSRHHMRNRRKKQKAFPKGTETHRQTAKGRPGYLKVK